MSLGIFASGILVFAISIVEYLVCRKKTLYKLYRDIYEFMSMLGADELRRDCKYEFHELRKIINSTIRFYNNVVYIDFQDILLLKKSELTNILEKLNVSANKIYNELIYDKEILDKYVLGDIEENKLYEHIFYVTKQDAVLDLKLLIKVLSEMRNYLNFYNSIEEETENEQ